MSPCISNAPRATSARPPGAAQPQRCARRELAHRHRHDEHEDRHRQEAQAGAERRVAEDVLQVDREEREQREHPGADRRTSPPTRRRTPAGGRATRRASAAPAGLDPDEDRRAARPRRPASRRSARWSSPRRCRAARRTISKSAAENVSSPQTSVRVASGSRDSRIRVAHQQREPPTGTLTKKTQRQLERVRDDPADERPGGHREADRRAPGRDRAAALRPAVLGTDQRERRREERRAADALQRAAMSSTAMFQARPHSNDASAEHDDADGEDEPAPEAVRERAGGEDQRRERDRVRVHDPLQPGQARVSCRWTFGSATFTTVMSSSSMNVVVQTATSVQRRSRARGSGSIGRGS